MFDDSFSALDLATDARLRAALAPRTADAAVLVVAQRVSTIRHADQILVLEDGEIVGLGTHDELVRTVPDVRRDRRVAGRQGGGGMTADGDREPTTTGDGGDPCADDRKILALDGHPGAAAAPSGPVAGPACRPSAASDFGATLKRLGTILGTETPAAGRSCWCSPSAAWCSSSSVRACSARPPTSS